MKWAIFYLILMMLATFSQVALALDYEEYPSIRLRSLDKITARTLTFDAQVGSIVKFGDIYIKVQSCKKPPPVEKNEAASFLQIWQMDKAKKESRWIFSGWMFASSPALSGMDHSVYDVWVIDCLGKDPEQIPVEDIKDSGAALPDEGTVPDNTVIEPDIAPEEQKQVPISEANEQIQEEQKNEIIEEVPIKDPPIKEPHTQDDVIEGIY